MARVKDLWFSEVTKKGPDGKPLRDGSGRVAVERRKTPRHPDRGGNKTAKRWLACWLDPDGNEKTKAFAKQDAAKKYADKMEADALRGEYIDPKAGSEKFGDLARKHLRLRDVGSLSRTRYDSTNRNHVEPVFVHRSVKGIKPSEIAEWLLGPMSAYSAPLRGQAYNIVAGTFDLAVADGLRRDNPARSPIVPVPEAGDPKERQPWDTATVWRVIEGLPEEYRAIAVCEAGLGLRQGCAFALAEEDFDFETGKVTIRRQIVRAQGGEFWFKLPKGGKERTIPVSRGVAAYIQAHIAKYPPEPYTLGWMREDGKPSEPRTCRLLFRWHGSRAVPAEGRAPRPARTAGRHIVASSFDHSVWLPALSRAGLAPEPSKDKRGKSRYTSGGRENGQHILRHFFETMLDDGGVSVAGQMEFLGHSRKSKKIPITVSVYGHVTEETFERARQAVDRTLFRLRPVESAGTVTELRSAQ